MNAPTEFRRARQIQAKKTGQNLNIFPPKSYFQRDAAAGRSVRAANHSCSSDAGGAPRGRYAEAAQCSARTVVAYATSTYRKRAGFVTARGAGRRAAPSSLAGWGSGPAGALPFGALPSGAPAGAAPSRGPEARWCAVCIFASNK